MTEQQPQSSEGFRPPDPATPTPLIGPPPTVWSSVGQKGNRSSSTFGGPGGGYSGPSGSSPWSRQRDTVDPNLLTREETKDLGKTNIGMKPFVPNPEVPEDLQMPERVPGFAEFALGGLAHFFTGVLPGWARDPVVRTAELVGEGLDIPLGTLDHIPINQLLGLEDVKGAFELMPVTEEKKRVIRAMSGANPTEMDYMMTMYLRSYAGDYAAAKEMPQLLANIIRPDASPVERLLMLLGVPAQFVARNVAGAFGRVEEIMEKDDEDLDPALLALKRRYVAGEFGLYGSEEAKQRFLDEITTNGYGWGDDPFISMLAEIATDPIIWASFGTGLALGAVRLGPIAARAANVAMLAGKGGAYAADNVVQAAAKRATDLVAQANLKTKNPLDLRDINSTKHWSDLFEKELGPHKLFDEATDMLKQPEPGQTMGQARAYRRWAAYKLHKPIEVAAGVSRALNEPLRLFGVDKAGKAVQEKWMRRAPTGAFAAFDYGKVYNIYNELGEDTAGLSEAMGYAIAHSQKSNMKGNLVKLIRTAINSGNDRLADHSKMPYALTNVDEVLERARVDGHPLEAQELQKVVEQWKKQYVPDNLPEDAGARKASYDKQMNEFREQAAQKFAHAAGVSIDVARRIFRNADPDELAFADYVHWGRTIKDFTEVRRKSKATLKRIADDAARDIERYAPNTPEREQAEELWKQANADLSNASRSTLVGPNELTLDRAQKLQKAMQNAKDDGERLRIIEEAANQYEYLHLNLYENVRITSDADLIHRMNTLLDEGIRNERFVKVLDDASLPKDLLDLKNRLKARGADYEIGLAPDEGKRWAPIYDTDDNLVGYHPWMDVEVDPTDINAPRRLDLIRERLAAPIRGENIVRKAQQRFVQRAAEKHGLNRGAALTVWSAVKKAARTRNITMRGFTPHEFTDIVNSVNITPHEKHLLGKRGLADLVAHAMEGEVRQVGLTTKFSGKAKTKSVRFANFLGQISEDFYPRLRFNLNPFFQLQEFIEPYFFNILRGVKVGFRWGEESLATHNLLDEFSMADRLADGFESREMMMHGAVTARNVGGPNTPAGMFVGDETPYGLVHTPKRVNYLNTLRERFGNFIYDAFEAMEQGSWVKIEQHYNNAAGKRLTRGEIAERWFRSRGLFDPDNQWSAMHHYDGAVPDRYGRIRGINTSYLARSLGLSSGKALRDAAADPHNGRITEFNVRNELVMNGASPEFARRAWAVITGPTVDDILDSIEGDFADKNVVGFHRDLARELLDRAAVSHGMSTEEFVATKFTQPVQWLNQNARLPVHAYTQVAKRMAIEYDLPPIDRSDPRHAAMAKAIKEMFPAEPDPEVVTAHVNAQKAEAAGKAPKKRPAQIQKPVTVAGFTFRAGQNHKQFADWIAKSGLTAEDVADIAIWYEELAGMFGGMAFGMPDSMVNELIPLLPDGWDSSAWRAGDAPDVEHVPLTALMRLQPGNRLAKSDPEAMAPVLDEIFEKEGPIILNYYQGDRTVVVAEGNHRLKAAEIAGREDVPVRVVRSNGNGNGTKVPGIEPNEDDYVPGNLAPSQVLEAKMERARTVIGARLFLAWMSTQVQASPQQGLMSALTLMDEVANGRRPSVHAKSQSGQWKPHMYDNQSNKYYAMLRDFDETLPDTGFGAKLYDFSDSSMAEIQRTYAGIAGGMMHKRMSDGLDHPMQPGAMDMWAMRERGYVDSPLLGYMASKLQRENIAKGKKGWEGDAGHARALIDIQKKTKVLYRTKKSVPETDKEGKPILLKSGKPKMKKVDISAEEYEAAKRAFETENGLKEGTMRTAWGGSPSAAEYEHALKQYHDLTDGLNNMKDDDGNVVGFMGRGYHTPGKEWTVKEIQAIAWVQMRKEFMVDDYNIQHFNSGQIQFRSDDFSPHMPIYEHIPVHQASEHVRDLLAIEMERDLAERITRLTGATLVRRAPGSQGQSGYGIVDNTFWQLQGSPEQIRDGARVLAYLTQSDNVYGLQPQLGINATRKGKVWALDFAVDDSAMSTNGGRLRDPRVLDRLGRWLDGETGGAQGFEWNGYGTGTVNDGRLAVRSVFDPAQKVNGAIRLKQSLTRAEFEERVPIPPEVKESLKDGSWAIEAGFDHPIPVDYQATIYDNVSYGHDWAGDADRAHARIAAGEDPHVVWSEEMGRGILEDLTNDGRGDIAKSLVTDDMAGFTAATDAALKDIDPDNWADARGREQLVGPYRGGVWTDPDPETPLLQARGTNSRGNPIWNGATKWSRDVDHSQRIIGPQSTSGRTANVYFREGRADVTTVVHELFHIYADDLQPSAIRNIHKEFLESPEGKAYLANGGTAPTSHNHLIREAEEWMAYQFEEWLGSGIAPNGTINNVFNDYVAHYNTLRMGTPDPDSQVAKTFEKATPELHRGQASTYDVDEYRFMEAARIAFLRAEEEAFRVHYYRRGRTLLERSLNHPYLGMYPVSYMWGKVLPEMLRFLLKKPFGVDAPLAGLALANHVYEAIQLELNVDDGAFAEFVADYPELVRFLQLMVPGSPWDIPVNGPAWARRLAASSYTGQSAELPTVLADTASYAIGPVRAPEDFTDPLMDLLDAGSTTYQKLSGTYVEEEEREQQAERRDVLRSLGANVADPNAPTSILTPRD